MKTLSGKIKRAATSLIMPVDNRRAGECKRCGSCCKFVYKCPFLKYDDQGSNMSLCTIHNLRPPQCRKYPRSKDEKAHEPCGYYFIE